MKTRLEPSRLSSAVAWSPLATLLVLATFASRTAHGQETGGSAAAAVAGGALGLYSGTLLATVGATIPCTQTYIGARCIRWSALGGAAIGLTTGILVGAGDDERLGDLAISSGIGFLGGTAAGLAVTRFAQRFGWQDVLAVGIIGGAVGSQPLGSAIGFGAGAGIGLILWQTVPRFEFADAMGASLAGLALGGLTEWVLDAVDAQSNESPALQLALPISVAVDAQSNESPALQLALPISVRF